MQIHELMTHAPAVCTTSDTLTRAAQIMWERDCGAVPITDANGQLVGIVTDRDLCMAAYTQGRALHEIRIADVMSKDLFTVGSDASASDAIELMNSKAVRRLPVVDAKGRLVGIVSIADCVRAAKSGAAKKPLPESTVFKAVAGVSASRTPEPTAPLPKSTETPNATKVLFPSMAAAKSVETTKAASTQPAATPAKSGKKR